MKPSSLLTLIPYLFNIVSQDRSLPEPDDRGNKLSVEFRTFGIFVPEFPIQIHDWRETPCIFPLLLPQSGHGNQRIGQQYENGGLSAAIKTSKLNALDDQNCIPARTVTAKPMNSAAASAV
jgi:hypothetical protein